MNFKDLINSLRPKGDYSKTDITNYSELSPGKIRAALLTKNQQELFPLFSLLEDKDSSLGSECDKRVNSVINKFYTHSLGNEENANVEEIIKASTHARLFGFALLELYIGDDGKMRVEEVEREFVRFEENRPMLRIKDRNFEAKEPFYIEIKTKPVLTKTLWIAYAKHYVLSLYLKFAEFLGVPPLVGNSSSGDEKVISAMAEAFSKIRSGSYTILGPNDIIKILEGRGSQADFMEFVRYCDSEFSKVINGSILSSNIGSSGSYAQSKIHDENRKEIIAGDVKFASSQVEKFYKRLGKNANLNVQIEKDSDLLTRARVLEILHPLGYKMSPQDMAREFDLPAPAQNSRLSANSKAKALYLDEIDRQSGELNSKSIESQILESIEDALMNASSYDEVYELLQKKFPSIKLDRLEESLSNYIANSTIYGIYGAE